MDLGTQLWQCICMFKPIRTVLTIESLHSKYTPVCIQSAVQHQWKLCDGSLLQEVQG